MGIYSVAGEEGIRMANDFAGTPTPTKAQPTPTSAPVQKAPVAPISKKTEPRKYLSGNIMDKIFDIVRTPEYAGTGFIQAGMEQAKKTGAIKSAPITRPMDYARSIVAGIKNIPKAISERREFGREEGQYNIAEEAGIKNKYAQTGINLAGSLAMPSLALGTVIKGVSKIPGVSKMTSKVGKLAGEGVELARKSPKIAGVVEKFDPFFKVPQLKKIVQETEENISRRQGDVIDLVTNASKKLKPEEQRLVGQILEGTVAKDPNSKYTKIAQAIADYSDEVGSEAVKLGLLNPESFQKYKGKYMTHIWEQMKNGGEAITFGKNIVPKITSKTWGKRKGKEGYISEFAPAVLKGLGLEVKDIEVSKMYQKIANEFGEKAGSFLEPGKAFAPSGILSSRAGKVLRNRELPQAVVDIMTKTMTPQKRNIFDKAYDLWKKGKTIYNPAYHVRNLLSNQVLTEMSTGAGLPKTLKGYREAVRAYKGKGSQEFVEAAKKANLIGRKNLGASVQEAMTTAGYGKRGNVLQKADTALKKFQNASEETSKLNLFTYWVRDAASKAGKTVQEALQDTNIINMAKKKAEQAIFSPYNISKAERGLAAKVVPFYSFTRQAVPFVGETLLNRPGTLTKYNKAGAAVEGLSPERKGEYRPEYAKGQVRLPFKDKQGRSYYFNPQYILPHGNLAEDVGGNLTRGRLPFGLSLAPQWTIPAELAMNKQMYYGSPITSSNAPSKQQMDYAKYLARSLGPSVYSSVVKLIEAIQQKEDWAGRTRNIPASILDVLGLKTSSFVPSEQKSFEQSDINAKLKSIDKEISKYRRSKDTGDDKYIQELLDERKKLLQNR